MHLPRACMQHLIICSYYREQCRRGPGGEAAGRRAERQSRQSRRAHRGLHSSILTLRCGIPHSALRGTLHPYQNIPAPGSIRTSLPPGSDNARSRPSSDFVTRVTQVRLCCDLCHVIFSSLSDLVQENKVFAEI